MDEERITTGWLEKNGFRKDKGGNYVFSDNLDNTIGFDLKQGLMWADTELDYVMRRVDTLDEVRAVYGLVGFAGGKFARVGDNGCTPINPSEFGFESGVRQANGFRAEYDGFTWWTKIISDDWVEGYEGVVKSAEKMKKVLEVFKMERGC